MRGMFSEATSFNQPLNTHTVTRPDGTTYEAWDTSNVRYVEELFHDTRVFNQDISNWDTSNVIDMHGMFAAAIAFNQPINTHTVTRQDGSTYEAWDTSKVNNMTSMFFNAHSFDQDISNWDVSNVRHVDRMFYGATAMLSKLPHLKLRDSVGTPDANDWKADMYPRDQLFIDYKKPRDKQKLASDFMKDLGSTDVLQTPLQSGLQNPSVQQAVEKYIEKERGFLFQ